MTKLLSYAALRQNMADTTALVRLSMPAIIRPRVATGDGFYDTNTLLEVIRSPELAPQFQGFWMKFFPREFQSDQEKIYFDQIDLNEYRLAPFVAPNVQGRPMRSKGFTTNSFRPAYVKPKHVVDPSRAVTRTAGEAFFGSMSMESRYNYIIADNLRRERLMIENRWDWMACQAVTRGSVTISGEDYPEVTVDFKRDPSLTTVLAGAAKWSSSTATVLADIASSRQKSFRLGKSPVNNLIFGIDAWASFVDPSHTDVIALMNAMRYGNDSRFNQNNVTDGGFGNYMGFISGTGGVGRLDLWTYSNFYEGDDGVAVPYMDPGTVVGVGDQIQGIRCFGAIMDRGARLQPMSMFPKMWDEEDPSVTYTLTQSAPLMVPMWPNNSFSLKVV